MVDVLTKKQRSFNMSRIKATHTKAEKMLRKLLYASGLRGYRLHYKLPGKPDIVFSRMNIAIFVDGCFWHKCPRCFVQPQTRKAFWMKKIAKNVERDKEINKKLSKEGWKVMRFWEHEIKSNPVKCTHKIRKFIKSDKRKG